LLAVPVPISKLNERKKPHVIRVKLYLVDVGNTFAEIEFCVFDAVAAFDFDEGGVW
jgi:hypothetical protein